MHYALRYCIGQTMSVTVNIMLVRWLQVLSARVQVNTVYIGYATATVNRDMRGLIFSILSKPDKLTRYGEENHLHIRGRNQ